MFNSLILSRPRHQKSPFVSGTIMSTVVHGVLIWTAVMVTSKPDQLATSIDRDTTIIVFPTTGLRRREEQPLNRQYVAIQPMVETVRAIPRLNVPTAVSPIATASIFDPRDYLVEGVETPFARMAREVEQGGVIRPLRMEAVDEPPERIGGPSPRYPDLLRQVGTEGTVLLQFVIDTTGHVEPGSLVVISATHRAFEAPALEAALRSRYRPARVRGRTVRVLVQQAIAFTIAVKPSGAGGGP
jgi:TonB family protein